MRTSRLRARLLGPHRAALDAVGAGLWLSGALWLLLHFIPRAPGPFGVTRHPVEPSALAVHGALAVAGTWMFGLLWGVHIPHGWSLRERRRSGALLVVVAAWLVMSGYLLYYLGDERLRGMTSALHWAVGLVCPIAFAAHRVRARFQLRAYEGTLAPGERRHSL